MEGLFKIITIPFGYVLLGIYDLIGSYGLAIILFTLLTKIIILPLTIKSKISMSEIQRLQPKLKALEKKYGQDKAKYQEEVAKMYQAEKVSVSGGCLPMLLTLPIMFGLYYVITKPLSYLMFLTDAQISAVTNRLSQFFKPGVTPTQIDIAAAIRDHYNMVSDISQHIMKIDFNLFGINLAQTPSFHLSPLLIIPVLSGVTAYLLNKVTLKMQVKITGNAGNETTAATNASMSIMMPAISVYFSFMLPAGVGLYWIAGNVFLIVQEFLLAGYVIKKLNEKGRIKAPVSQSVQNDVVEVNEYSEVDSSQDSGKKEEDNAGTDAEKEAAGNIDSTKNDNGQTPVIKEKAVENTKDGKNNEKKLPVNKGKSQKNNASRHSRGKNYPAKGGKKK